MEDLPYPILKDFKINSCSIKKYRGAYIIKDKNPKILFKTNYKTDNILSGAKISNLILKNGIKTTDKFYTTKSNNLFSTYDGECYIIHDYLDFNQNVFENKDLFLSFICQLGKFHKILRKQNINLMVKKDYLTIVEKNILEINGIRKKVLRLPRKMDFDILFLNSWNNFEKDLEKVHESFSTEYFYNLLEKSILENHVAHGNIKEESIVNYKNHIYINNLLNCYIGIQLEDISKAFIKYIKNSKEPIKLWEVIHTYNNIIPLNDADIEIIEAFIIYPYKYIKIINDYYVKSRTWTPTSFIKSLEMEIDIKTRSKHLW